MRVTEAATLAGGSAIGEVEMVLICLPTTSTFDGAESSTDLPLKMRTFSKMTPVAWGEAAEAASMALQLKVSNAVKRF